MSTPHPAGDADPPLAHVPDLVRMFEPLVILPAQLGTPVGIRRQPEKRLMAAVLRTALADLGRYGGTPGGRRKGVYAQALTYVSSADRRWPYAFLNVCEALGLDPWRIRAAALGVDGG